VVLGVNWAETRKIVPKNARKVARVKRARTVFRRKRRNP